MTMTGFGKPLTRMRSTTYRHTMSEALQEIMKSTKILSLAALLPLLALGAESRDSDFKAAIASKPNFDNGEALFEQCVSCHGRDGGGSVTGSIPRIAGQHYSVLVRQIIDFRYGKRWDVRMEGVMAKHSVLASNQDIADVAAYVSNLERDGNRGVGDGYYVERGAAVYARGCASCHGAAAEGDDARGIPRLSGQHAGYLARQIYDAVDARRLPLAETHRKRLVHLDFEEVLGLTDYLSRIGWNLPAETAR
jgi:cytochrome c553